METAFLLRYGGNVEIYKELLHKRPSYDSGVPRGVWGVQNPTSPRNSETEPNSEIRGK
jgi:hypothetical protein